MKKIVTFILTFCLILSLCACGKSEAATAYESLVEKIGTVSLDSEIAITDAENAYNALSDEEKESVADSHVIFTEKRKAYDEMVVEAQLKAEQEARLASVTALIEAIGDVTLDSKAALVEAENAYADLSDEEKEMISEVAAQLHECRAVYDAAVAAQMEANAAEVSAAIDAIGTVTLDSKDAIANAKELYNALTGEEKTLVTNYSTLANSVTEYDSLWEAEKQRIIDEYSKKFEIETDPIEGISWYTPKNMPHYIDTRSYIIPYIGIRSGNPWICIRYNYTADEWIFWENLTIMVDGEKYYKQVGYYNTIRDNDTEVWEYYDEALNVNQGMHTEELRMLKAIGESEETIIRFQGDNYHYDLYVSDKDKQIIRDTLVLYEAMLG